MAEDKTADQSGTGEAGKIEAPAETPKQEPKVEEQKLFTQSDLNRVAAERAARVKADAIDAAATEKAAEALSRVAEIEGKLAAAELKAQLLELGQKGAPVELLEATGLKGDALSAYAEKLIAVLPQGGRQKAPAGSATAEATVASFINQSLKPSINDSKDAWKDRLLEKMNEQVAQR